MSCQYTLVQAAIKMGHFGFITAPRLMETIIVSIICFFRVADLSNCAVLKHRKEIFTFIPTEAHKAI